MSDSTDHTHTQSAGEAGFCESCGSRDLHTEKHWHDGTRYAYFACEDCPWSEVVEINSIEEPTASIAALGMPVSEEAEQSWRDSRLSDRNDAIRRFAQDVKALPRFELTRSGRIEYHDTRCDTTPNEWPTDETDDVDQHEQTEQSFLDRVKHWLEVLR